MRGRDPDETPLSILIGERGIKDSSDFAEFFTALMTDIASGSVLASDATAMCKAGDKIIRMKELEFQYGSGVAVPITRRRTLEASKVGTSLPSPETEAAPDDAKVTRIA